MGKSMYRSIKRNIVICVVLAGVSVVLLASDARASFPWAYIHGASGKDVVSLYDARDDYDDAIGKDCLPTKTSPWEKDVCGLPSHFGYSETMGYVDRHFETEVDLRGKDYGVMLIMFVDDSATLEIYEIDASGDPGDEPVHSFRVGGGAVWNPASYKEDDYILSSGKRYKLELDYRNDLHWNDNRVPGKEDVDGVSVYKVEVNQQLVGVNGDGFELTGSGPYANRVWLGTWLDLMPPQSDLFDWGILKKYGGGVILSKQEFSWELTDEDDEVYSGSKGPMYFVDEFEIDSNGELIPSSSNGVWPAEPAGTGYGMHMSLLNAETFSLIDEDGFETIPDTLYPYDWYSGIITVKFEAELYPAGTIPNPTSGFNSPSGGGGTTEYHPFYPEICHKYWSPSKPSWAGSDPICTTEQTFEITWEAFMGAPSCSPSLPNGPNRLGK